LGLTPVGSEAITLNYFEIATLSRHSGIARNDGLNVFDVALATFELVAGRRNNFPEIYLLLYVVLLITQRNLINLNKLKTG
jgi:hypothetical protein